MKTTNNYEAPVAEMIEIEAMNTMMENTSQNHGGMDDPTASGTI